MNTKHLIRHRSLHIIGCRHKYEYIARLPDLDIPEWFHQLSLLSDTKSRNLPAHAIYPTVEHDCLRYPIQLLLSSPQTLTECRLIFATFQDGVNYTQQGRSSLLHHFGALSLLPYYCRSFFTCPIFSRPSQAILQTLLCFLQ